MARGNYVEITAYDVLDRVHLHIIRQTGDELETYCPECDGTSSKKHGHLYINVRKNVFHCQKCKRSGNALQLYAWLENLDTKEAYKILAEEITRHEKRKRDVKVQKREEPVVIPDNEIIAPVEVRDKIYRALLKQLTLNQRDILHLEKRGISREVAFVKFYRSLDVYDVTIRKKICKNIIVETGIEPANVPGFYKNSGEWDFVPHSGFAIPVRNEKGQIQALQIRITKEGADIRYKWFSSSWLECGTKCKGCVHVVGSNKKEVFITEGILKADIASHYHNSAVFLAIPGVSNNHNDVVKILQTLKINKVFVAFDNDVKTKPEVQNALNKLMETLTEGGIVAEIYEFDEKYKGIDDYFVAMAKIREAR